MDKTKKNEPVQKFYDHYIVILKILYDGPKNVNKIFKLVKEFKNMDFLYQSSKTVTIDVKNELLKYQLAEEKIVHAKHNRRNAYRIKKKPRTLERIIQLTPLGCELSGLIFFIEEYKQKYTKLKEKINYHFNVNDGSIIGAVLRERLRQRDWKAEEIPNYGAWVEGILSLETHLPLVIFSSLLSRYFKIIYNYYPLNRISKEILENTIMDAMTKNILARLEGILADKVFADTSERENAFNQTYGLLSGWTTTHFLNHVDTFSKNRFIEHESLELVKTLNHILNPGEDFLRNMLGRQAKTNAKLGELIKFLEGSRNSRKP